MSNPDEKDTPSTKAGSAKLVENSKAMYWSALCINGRTSLNDLHAVNQLTHQRPDVSKVCKADLPSVMKKQ